MSYSGNPIMTVGHSNGSADAFVTLLRLHGVTAVADVRSAPYSRFSPQFNREGLERDLKAQGIKYVFLGRELGARSDDRSCYEHGTIQYAKLAATAPFQAGVDRLLKGARDQRIALMCAEKEPLDCHRAILVAPVLVHRGLAVEHILADGRCEPHETTMDRLLKMAGLPPGDMFRTRADCVVEALLRRERKIAYVDDQLVADAVEEAR